MNQASIQIYFDLIPLFSSRGFRLFLVGGAVRDYLLERPVDDFDFATDATPTEMATFLPNIRATFARFGNIQFYFQGQLLDITTFRQEDHYLDARHPTLVKFVKTPAEDYPRRDFTVNALYMDEHGNILDFTSGFADIRQKVIRMIGDPLVRLSEDPLRILRALRQALTLDFEIERQLADAIIELAPLVEDLTPAKANHEIERMFAFNKPKALELLASFGFEITD